ncbi:unnamed protein product [Choristocarpus tenellus]
MSSSGTPSTNVCEYFRSASRKNCRMCESSPSLGSAIDHNLRNRPFLTSANLDLGMVSPALGAGGDGVPDIVNFRGETLKFGDYRRPSLVERSAITLASIGLVVWTALRWYRRLKQPLSRALLTLATAPMAWLMRATIMFSYRECTCQPKLRTAETVTFKNSFFNDFGGLKVHYLRTEVAVEDEEDGGHHPTKSVLHLGHGFGASSLSWTPVLGSLSKAFRAVAVAHDTPGFGLTERPGLRGALNKLYSLDNNAVITAQLVQHEISKIKESEELGAGGTNNQQASAQATSPQPPVFLMAHSMGCITSTTAALDPSLDPLRTTLVLVAPAILPHPPSHRGIPPSPSSSGPDPNPFYQEEICGSDSMASGMSATPGTDCLGGRGEGAEGGGVVDKGSASDRLSGKFRSVLGLPRRVTGALTGVMLGTAKWIFDWLALPLFYPAKVVGLRALAYQGKFWKFGLQTAWFDKEGVTVDVINRYRWPTLIQSWERGMALFLLSRLQFSGGGLTGSPGLVEALAAKAARGMKIVIVQGENDPLVSLVKVKNGLAEAIPEAKLVVMPECGHVPHEEQPEEFVRMVLQALDEE